MSLRYTGQRLGRWLVEDELARGGWGLVLRARDPETGERAAIKLLAQGSEVARARFSREADVLARVSHPHLVRILDRGEQRGVPWLALELLPGPTLAERLEREGPLPVREVLSIGLGLAGALEALHAAGIVHRDIKPTNVVLDVAGRARLLDLGLARDLDPQATQLSRTGQFMGTPGYLAPEQALGDLAAIGPATDVWGLGATLHTLLTGQPPHGEGDPLSAAQGRPVAPPSGLRPDIPAQVEEVLLRCLALAPGERFPDARSVRLALELALLGLERAPAGGAALPFLAGVILTLGVVGAAWVILETKPTPAPASVPAAPLPPRPERPDPARTPEELHGRAQELLATDPRAAEALLDQALLRDPDHVPSLAARAALRSGREELPGALTDYDRWIALDPRNPTPLVNRGQLRLGAGEAQGALRDLDQALALAPDEPTALGARGMAWIALGDIAQAAADLARSLELQPDGAPARARTTSLAELRAQVEVGRGHAGLTPLGLMSRAGARLHSGQLEAALQDYTLALVGDPGLVDAWLQRAALQERLGRPERARADAARADELLRERPPGELAPR